MAIMYMYQGIVKDRLHSLPTRKTKYYKTRSAAHNAAEKLCKRTYGNRGSIDTREVKRKK